jgi:DNA helicase-2/ATP-dependent DNA helicase PcrA
MSDFLATLILSDVKRYNIDMNQEFAASYKQLNDRQKEAVDAIDGPVLVVAGPGTGKTQILSLRVASILQRTDSDPGSVLCLTFTNFAATNMRDRLARLVGPSAHNVMVRTFHSFAAEIMNLYPDYFWNGARLQIAPDAVQLEIIQDILSELPLDNPLALKFAGAFTALNDVQQGMRLAKEAGLTPEKLAAMIAVNSTYLDVIEPQLVEILSATLSAKKLPGLLQKIEELPDQNIDETVTPLTSLSTVIKDSFRAAAEADLETSKTTQTGKLKRQWVQTVNGQKGLFDERRRNQWWQALSGVYAQYRDRLHKVGYYDYSDMIVEVITQLEQQPELLASVQERFLYVLIDEFQDTNAAQLRLAHLVASNFSSEGKPNLMAVGDDDQSIFAFNGAELNNMLTFRRTYQDTKTIVLSDNYRSTQDVLDTAQTVIEQADDRLVKREADLTKDLRAKSDASQGTIEHLRYPTRQHQLTELAKRVKQTWQDNPEQDIAVLARGHESLSQLSSLLNLLKVPLRYERQNNVLEHPLVQQVNLLAEIVVGLRSGDQDIVNRNLAIILQHPVWKISSKQLWKFAVDNYAKPHWLESLLDHPDDKLVDLGQWLLWLARETRHEPLPVILDYLIGLRAGSHLTSPLRQYFLTLRPVDSTYLEGLSAIQTLRDAANEFATAHGKADLEDYVRFIGLHNELQRPITDESWFLSGGHTVQLMTVHKSKGLEFDTVFLADATEDNWKPRHIGRKPPANLPLQPYGEQYDDYVRLLYVAATRARSSFVVTSYAFDGQGRELLSTPLINQLPVLEIDSKQVDTVEVLEQTVGWPRLESSDEKSLLQARIDKYRLSPTAFLQFLDITTGGPQHFLERQLLRLPEVTTATMAYGTAIHRALQIGQQLSNSNRFTLQAVLETYETALEGQLMTTTDYSRYLEHGKKTLINLFEEKGYELTKDGQPEVSINELRLGDALVTGKIDLVNANGNELLISDYKTGKPLTNFTTGDQTKAVKAWRHRNQLMLYMLMTKQSGRFRNATNIKSRMIYVEAESAAELSLELPYDDAGAERLERLVNAVWKHVCDLHFPDVRHYKESIDGITLFEEDLLSGNI